MTTTQNPITSTCQHCNGEVRRSSTTLVDDNGEAITRWQHRDLADPIFWNFRCPTTGRFGIK